MTRKATAQERSAPTTNLEEALHIDGFRAVAGVDEAGRGCLAGPVVSSAVLLPETCALPFVRDSKLLTATARREAREAILDVALAVGVGMCSVEEIDRLNILWAAMESMKRAVAAMTVAPDYVLIDGNRAPRGLSIPFRTVVRGDRTCLSIAAASIIAKTHRDALMGELHSEHPVFGWDHNFGYPTKRHYEALAANGPTVHHRRSFRLA